MAAENMPWKKAPQPAATPPAQQVEFQETLEFLEQLRPGGPWVLTAIVPDGSTETISAFDSEQVLAFTRKHNGKRNLYFSVNPTRSTLTHKAAKTDIAAVEYIPADLDPKHDETADDAKHRYLNALTTHQPPPTAIIDSGNGIQCLWKLAEPINLGVPETREGKRVYGEADLKIIENIEQRTAALMARLGSVAGTQNIDRILRLPGTINIPNKKKLAEGRVQVPTKLVRFNNSLHSLIEFPLPDYPYGNGHTETPQNGRGLSTEQLFKKLPAALRKAVASPPFEGEDTSATAAAVINQLQTLNFMDGEIIELFNAYPKGIGKRYAEGKDLNADVARLRKKYQTQSKNKSIMIIKAADVRPRAIEWLWEGHLRRGAQELLTGTPGLGKTQVQIFFVACVTAGLAWPDNSPPTTPADVVMLTAEDTIEQDVIPRLIAAGADINKVHILNCIRSEGKNRQFLLAEDLDILEKLVLEIGNVGLITVDPITAYMGGKMDSHKATEVRSQLGPLKDFAERTNIAISTITHPPKSASNRAIDHFIGSQAFIAAGRVGHLCVPEMIEDDEGGQTEGERVLFTMAKTNSQRMPTLMFKKEIITIGNDHVTGKVITAPRVVWEQEASPLSANEAVAASAGLPTIRNRGNAQVRLQNMLVKTLKDNPLPQTEMEALSEAAGYTENQLRTAKQKLGIVSERVNGVWMWHLITAKLSKSS